MERWALVVAAAVSLVVTALSGYLVVPLMHKLKFGQTINEIGPAWHKEKKQGIPTMGGVMFVAGTLLGLLLGAPLLAGSGFEAAPGEAGVLVLGTVTALAFAFIGFIDDYLKVVRKQNLGLRAGAKLVMQGLVATSFLLTLHLMGKLSTLVQLPFLAQPVDFGIFFYPLSLVLIVGIVNAVNLTDGLDGLCSSVTLCVMCGFLALLVVFGQLYGGLLAAAMAGGCAGFLFWNMVPAKIIMGDTGSMFLGGVAVVLGYGMGRPDVLIILSAVYLWEALSVMIQVTYFKLTHGKRLFKMTPIHHSFELRGWSEMRIDLLFSGVAVLACVAAFLYAYVFA